MSDHSKPVLTSTYTNFVSEIDGRFDDLAVGLDPAVTTATNLPTNSIRWSSAGNTWQKFNGSIWSNLSTTYALSSITASGTIVSTGAVTAGGYRTAEATLGTAEYGMLDRLNPSTRMFIGDGTGYNFKFLKRVGSVNTDLLTILDTGSANMSGSFASGTGISAGKTTAPTAALDIVGNTVSTGTYNSNATLGGAFTNYISNGSTATNAYSEFGVGNATGTSYLTKLRLLAFSTSYTTSGAYAANSGTVEAAASLSGGLNVVSANATANLKLYSGGAAASNLAMSISPLGNVGIASAPNTWISTSKALQLGTTGKLVLEDSSNGSIFGNNYYRDSGGLKYRTTAASTIFNQVSGVNQWLTAPSGTADTTATFTERMRLDNTGNFYLGTTTAGATNSKSLNYQVGTSVLYCNHDNTQVNNAPYLSFGYNAVNVGSIVQNGTTGIRVTSVGNLDLSGTTVTAPTAAITDNSTSVATTAFVKSSANIQLGTAVNTTSGTAFDYTSIPASAKRINIMFDGVLRSGTSFFVVRLGTGGVPETTGYKGSATALVDGTSVNAEVSTTGFQIRSNVAVNDLNGCITLFNMGGNKWQVTGSLSSSIANYAFVTSGSKTLAGTLDMIRFTTISGSDAFTAGSINVSYEF